MLTRSKKHKFTNDEIDIIRELYKTKSASYIQQQLNYLTIHQITSCIKKHKFNIESNRRIFDVNLDFFSTLSTESIYWAGFIAADGCIHKKNKLCQLSIKLSNKDAEHLIKLQQAMNTTNPIQYGLARKKYPQAMLRISGAHKLANDLYTNFNITQRKSLTLNPPNNLTIEQSIIYIKGLLDGDGQINIYTAPNNKYRFRLGFSGTQQLMLWIQDILHQLYPIKTRHKLRKNGNLFEYIFDGEDALAVAEILHSYKTPELERKWNTIQQYKNMRDKL